MRTYNIPKEVKTEVKVKGNIYLRDVVIFFGMGVILWFFQDNIHKNVLILYWLGFLGSTFWLLLPSIHNKKRRNYQSLLYMIQSDKNYYHPISRETLSDFDDIDESGENSV